MTQALLTELKRIEKAVLFFSLKSGDVLSERGMIHLLRFWASGRQCSGLGLEDYLNGLANALEENIGGSDANRN